MCIRDSGNTGPNPGKVNSWFDHSFPTYQSPPNFGTNNLRRWDGQIFDFNTETTSIGISWYDGHDGIDFSGASGEPVLAAESGIIINENNRWGCLGWHVIIDHENGFRTVYGHLRDQPTVTGRVNQGDQIGVVGTTYQSPCSSTGPHLHFGVYIDPNRDGNWADQIQVDPYGWRGTVSDPWEDNPKTPLWIHPLGEQGEVDSTGGSVSSSSDIYQVIVPSGAVTDTITLDLQLEPSVYEPSAQLRSTGRSFWLQVLEWLQIVDYDLTSSTSASSFSSPVTITISYTDTNLIHMDENQLSIHRWSDTGSSWEKLPTTLDTVSKLAFTQSSNVGHFDLQAPLLCPDDISEYDDNYDYAVLVDSNETPLSRLFDISEDEDWMRLDAFGGTNYTIHTINLASGVDTVLEIYDIDGVTSLASDNDSGDGLASKLSWEAPASGTYFIRVSQSPGSAYGCSASYDISVEVENLIYLPITIR